MAGAHINVPAELVQRGANNKDLSFIESLSGATPLMHAVRKGSDRLVELLLLAGADPNLAKADGCSPLVAAVGAGNDKILKMLLAAGAKPNETIDDKSKVSPSSYASFHGSSCLRRVALKVSEAETNAVADENNSLQALYLWLHRKAIKR